VYPFEKEELKPAVRSNAQLDFLKQNLTEANVKNLGKLLFLLALLAGAVQTGFCRGDKVIPQVVDGPNWKTKFDITNLGSRARISSMRVSFFKADGTPWNLRTNLFSGTDFTLDMAPRQTIRLETLGQGSQVTAGYVIIYDEESGNSEYSDDYVLGISVFYEYSTVSGIADTVTVSVPQPTAAANAPMQMDASKGIYSGLAIVNCANVSNSVKVDLYSGNTGQFYGTITFSLNPKEQWSGYLDNQKLFPGLSSFKGMAQITSSNPIALLALLETRAGDGNPQYSTLAPVDREALRRNTQMVFLQASDDSNPYMPLDLDGFVADYWRTIGLSGDTESYSWDLEYIYAAPDGTNRSIKPVSENGVGIASLGNRNSNTFDAISLPELKALTYSKTASINLSNGTGTSLYTGFTFAVHTDLGNYAKVRIVRIIDTQDGTYYVNNKDLILEVCIYK
jgi:hypothetical protein